MDANITYNEMIASLNTPSFTGAPQKKIQAMEIYIKSCEFLINSLVSKDAPACSVEIQNLRNNVVLMKQELYKQTMKDHLKHGEYGSCFVLVLTDLCEYITPFN
jgi:hypothetical protein